MFSLSFLKTIIFTWSNSSQQLNLSFLFIIEFKKKKKKDSLKNKKGIKKMIDQYSIV